MLSRIRFAPTGRTKRCHSKKINNPSWANKTTQENPRSHFNTFGSNFRKKSYFSVKIPSFPEKNYISSPKISDDFFFLDIDSHFQIFTPRFRHFQPFLPLNLLFIPHFDPRNT